MNTRMKDITGQKFTRLLALEPVGKKYGEYLWKCLCDCGNTTIVLGSQLRNGNIKACGCLRTTHGDSRPNKRHRLYSIWLGMKARCLNPNNRAYANYGGRGIQICQSWKEDYVAFKEWALQNGYEDNLTIDRINVNGNYEPANCRWADNRTQAFNKRTTVYVTYNNETHNLDEWSEITGIPVEVLRNRHNHKSDEEVISQEYIPLTFEHDGETYRCMKDYALENNANPKQFRHYLNKGKSVEYALENHLKRVFYEFNGESHTLPEWSRITGIHLSTLRSRVKTNGWPIEKALTEPVDPTKASKIKHAPRRKFTEEEINYILSVKEYKEIMNELGCTYAQIKRIKAKYRDHQEVGDKD